MGLATVTTDDCVLPCAQLELQNSMALGGGGGGQTYRSWAQEEDGLDFNEEYSLGDNNTD